MRHNMRIRYSGHGCKTIVLGLPRVDLIPVLIDGYLGTLHLVPVWVMSIVNFELAFEDLRVEINRIDFSPAHTHETSDVELRPLRANGALLQVTYQYLL